MLLSKIIWSKDMQILDFSHKVLRDLRRSKNLTQQELADKLELTQGAIAKYEKDRIPNWDELKKIGKFFDVYFVADWDGKFPPVLSQSL